MGRVLATDSVTIECMTTFIDRFQQRGNLRDRTVWRRAPSPGGLAAVPGAARELQSEARTCSLGSRGRTRKRQERHSPSDLGYKGCAQNRSG